MSRRAVRALPSLAVVLSTVVLSAVLLSLAVVSAGAATVSREAAVAPEAVAPVAPAAETAPAVLPPAADAALCPADSRGRATADLDSLLLPRKCTGQYCAVPQDCQCSGHICACVDNSCICV